MSVRRHRQEWQCLAFQILEGSTDVPAEPHLCVLEKLHFGKHVCWCGWAFAENTASWHQPSYFGA